MSLFGKNRDEDGGEVRGPAAPVPSRGPAAPAAERAERARGREPISKGGEELANVGKSIAIKGDLSGNEDLVIEGKVEGKVDLPSNELTVGANGVVQAEVHAKAVVIIGRVAGNVVGSERIEIQATGVVEGDVSAPRLVVAEGAVVNGSIRMGKEKAGAAAPPAPAAATGGEARKAG